MLSSQKIQRILGYLEVGLTADEQSLLIDKLHSADLPYVEVYTRFPKSERIALIGGDYQAQWNKAYRSTEAYQARLVQEVQSRLARIPEEKQCPAITHHIQLLAHAKLIAHVNRRYQRHQSRLNAAIENNQYTVETELLDKMLLAHKVQKADKTQEAFLQNEKQRYLALAQLVSMLDKMIMRVEGTEKFSTPDYRRWAQFLIKAEDKGLEEDLKSLNIGIKRTEHSETFEGWAQFAGIALKGLSVAIALFSVVSHAHPFFTEETFKEGLEEVAVTTECSSLLIAGIILCLKGDPKLGLTYVGLGTGMLASEVITAIADFGPHFMTAATSASVLGFVGSACTFALALINHRKANQADKRYDELQKALNDIDSEIARPQVLAQQLEDEASTLQQDKNEQIFLQHSLVRRQAYEAKLGPLEVLKQNMLSKKQTYQAAKQAHDELLGNKAVLQVKISQLGKNVEPEIIQPLRVELDEVKQKLKAASLKLEAVESLFQRAKNGWSAKKRELNKMPGARLETTELLQQHIAAKQLQIESTQQHLNELETAKQEAEADVPFLNSQRRALVEAGFHEKALAADCRQNRNFLIGSGVILATSAVLTLTLASVTSMGIVPIVLLSLAAVGLGLSLFKRFVIGNSPHADNLKKAHNEMDKYNNLIESQSTVAQNLGIDSEKFEVLGKHIHSKILTNPLQADELLDCLEVIKDASLTEAEIVEAKKDLAQSLKDHKANTLLETLELEESDTDIDSKVISPAL